MNSRVSGQCSNAILTFYISSFQASDGDMGMQSRVLIRVPSSSDLTDAGVTALEHSEIGTAMELAGSIDHSQQGRV